MSDEQKVVVDPEDTRREHQEPTVGAIVGAGGMGVVREAFDSVLRRRMAIKVLHHNRVNDPTDRLRFIEEAQITAQLDHPNIIPVHELGGGSDGGLHFTMKLVEGETLTRILSATPLVDRSPKDLFDLLQTFLKVCDAVAFAHSRDVIHRDLKPDNVMVGRFGQVYLMDWGVARAQGRLVSDPATASPTPDRESFQTEDGTIVGTLAYMPPEQVTGKQDAVDERSDVFALGAILYQILTLEPPYPETSLYKLLPAVAKCEILPPQKRTPSPLPPRLCKVAMKALSREPGDRYQSVAELKRDVERFLQSGWQFPMRIFPAGALIVREGTAGATAYVILGGTCRAFRDHDGERQELRTMQRGDVFGETAVFSRRRRTASVEAVDRVTAIEITRAQFEEDLGMGFWMGLFVNALAERFQEKEQRAMELEHELAELTASR